MEIKIKQILKRFDGKPIVYEDTKEPLTFGSSLSTIMVSAQNEPPIKMYVLGQKFADKTAETVKLDQADLILVKKVVENSKAFGPLVLGQILIMLNEGKEGENE